MLGPPSGGAPGQPLPLRLSHQNLQGRRKVLREEEQAHTPQEPPGLGWWELLQPLAWKSSRGLPLPRPSLN